MQLKLTGPGTLAGWSVLRPALAPLLAQATISTDLSESEFGVHCPAPGLLHICPDLHSSAQGLLLLRYGLELSWLSAVKGLGMTAAAVLAARTAGLFAAMPGVLTRGTFVPQVFTALSCNAVDAFAASQAARLLASSHPGGGVLTKHDLICIEALWPLALPTECLLASGGDDRLSLDPQTGLNRYGCTPWPRVDAITFGSCTASSVSTASFVAAEEARQSLVAASLRTAPSVALAAASDMIGAALLDHFGVADLAEAVLAASGTDAALVVTGLFAAERPGETLTSILMSPSETGSGVPDAVQGRHFASSAPAGCKVGKGQPIDGLPFGPQLVTVALREASGEPRPQAGIAADCVKAIRAGAARGHVVLHAIDESKTGMASPDRATCRELAAMFGDKLDIVVDACQARIDPALLRWYLSQGFPVLVTGSKFFSAPGFCGVVLFPRGRLRSIARHGRLPPGLAPYARLEGGFGSRRCPGLVLRWCAALHQMAAFAGLPSHEVGTRLIRMGESVHGVLRRDDRLRLMEVPRPASTGWSGHQSVFTFRVRGDSNWLRVAELRAIYQSLNADLSANADADHQLTASALCQIGQPVELGGAQQGGGLRIAISAAQVVDSSKVQDQLEAVFTKLIMLLDRGVPNWAATPSSADVDAVAANPSRVLLTG